MTKKNKIKKLKNKIKKLKAEISSLKETVHLLYPPENAKELFNALSALDDLDLDTYKHISPSEFLKQIEDELLEDEEDEEEQAQ